MRHKISLVLFVIYISVLMPATTNAVDVSEFVTVVPIEGVFSDVKERVIFAVESQGLVVDHTSDVGGMLSRTGKDLGENGTIYENAEVLSFVAHCIQDAWRNFHQRFLLFVLMQFRSTP